MDIDNQKGAARKIADLSTTVESTDSDVATDITSKLSEKKDLFDARVFRHYLVPHYASPYRRYSDIRE